MEKVPLKYWPALWRRAMGEHIDALFPTRPPVLPCPDHRGQVRLTGGFYTALKRCGLAHVVTVSGMHMSMVVMLAAMLVRRRRRKMMAIVSIPLVLAFMALTGFAPSVVRAGVMQILLLAGPRPEPGGGHGDLPVLCPPAAPAPEPQRRPWMWAFSSPSCRWRVFSPYRASQREVFPPFPLKRGKTKPRRLYNRVVRFLVGCVTMSIGAIAFTTPLTVYYFGTVSLVSPLANLLTLWAVTVLFLLCLPAAAGRCAACCGKGPCCPGGAGELAVPPPRVRPERPALCLG